MNIEQYRAMKAEMEAEQPAESVVEDTKIEDAEPAIAEPTGQTEQAVEPDVKEEPVEKQAVLEIDGEKLTLDDLKNGYLRQADYTKKTQELAKQRKEVEEAIKKFQPTPNQNIQQTQDSAFQKIAHLEEKLYDLMLEQEINNMRQKYSDFDTDEVISVAYEKKIENLEDAYMLWKARKPVVNDLTKTETIDIEKLKADIRKELRSEIEEEYKNTRTTVGTGSSAQNINSNTPELTDSEKRVARNMGMSEKEYYAWKVGSAK